MPFLELKNSPHAPGVSPVAIHYRDVGGGRPLVFLHGGWGYGVYPINRQVEAFQEEIAHRQIRFIIPDRSGHGRSSPFAGPLPPDFHRRAAGETLLLLDSLGIQRATFWGHSDGAVIAAMIGLMAPARCEHLLLEALHLYRKKPASHSVFFQKFADHPESVSAKLQKLLADDHGNDHGDDHGGDRGEDHGANRWQHVVQRNCRVWLQLANESTHPQQDLYDGRLSELSVPVTFMHGRHDPRTEPGEIERAHQSVPASSLRFVETGRHSPHSEEASAAECSAILRRLITDAAVSPRYAFLRE
jgi:pimeloyl-ACP methyl ester carboxylesterase